MDKKETPKFGRLEQEIHFWLFDVEREPGEEYTRRDALQDIDGQDDGADPILRSQLREYLIACGVYAPIIDEHLSRMMVSSGRKYDFSLRGQKYIFTTWDNRWERVCSECLDAQTRGEGAKRESDQPSTLIYAPRSSTTTEILRKWARCIVPLRRR